MRVNLGNKVFFEVKEVLFDKKVNFVFGKNGCGKSTISSLIKEQYSSEYDVRVFNGFDGVVGENSRLETVILGEENNDINNQILELEREIDDIKREIDVIRNNISESEDNPNNLWKEHKNKIEELVAQQKMIDEFYSRSAKEIKEDSRRFFSPLYNCNSFERDISNAKLLSDNTIKELDELAGTDIRNATRLPELDDNLEKELEEVNEILQDKVKEQKLIHRFENNERKKTLQDLVWNYTKSGNIVLFVVEKFLKKRLMS